MSTIICNRQNCNKRIGGNMCGYAFPMMNQFGCCSVWFDKNGNARLTPLYYEDVRAQETMSTSCVEAPMPATKNEGE